MSLSLKREYGEKCEDSPSHLVLAVPGFLHMFHARVSFMLVKVAETWKFRVNYHGRL